MAVDIPARTASDRIERLRTLGVSIWLDSLSRDLVGSGDLQSLADDLGVTGATSNPAIFERALEGTHAYEEQIEELVADGASDPVEAFLALALDDVRAAASVLAPAHVATAGRDGHVSFECTPDLAYDEGGTVKQALSLWRRLARPNVMIKVPATEAGVGAIERLTARGVNVNVTLLFSLDRYAQVIEAYLRGLERRRADGLPLHDVASVASFFVSRVDSKADALLPPGSPLRGKVAIANARLAYAVYAHAFAGPRWERLRAAGARRQRPLWASTGTKDPGYSDVLYVERLIAPDVINTMPLATLRAYADHGAGTPFTDEGWEAERVIEEAARAGVELPALTAELEREGVAAFQAAYERLLARLDTRMWNALS